MKSAELYVRARRLVFIQGMSRLDAERFFEIDRHTIEKMLAFWVPPGYLPMHREQAHLFFQIVAARVMKIFLTGINV